MCHAARVKINKLLLAARRDLVDPGLTGSEPVVLLEGSWPEGTPPKHRWSLDDEVDARFHRIDEEASRLAERLAEPCFTAGHDEDAFGSTSPAWLNALGLRYYLVKLIRLVTYFTEVRPLAAEQTLQLVVARGRDEDYVDCIAQLCRLAGACCRVAWIERPKVPDPVVPANSRWRRALAGLCDHLGRRRLNSPSRPRVVLCGNPRLLDPVCRELLRRGSSVFWLYDRFSLRSWLRWRTSGVGQLVLDSSEAQANRLVYHPPDRLECGGLDLAGAVGQWIAARLRTHGPRQTRIVEKIDAHFRRIRPDALVLDEDATPTARAAVALARQYGAASFVVQHGAPLCRFGFAPLAADRILVWGRSSREQLARWGVPEDRIDVVGSAKHETLYRALSRGLDGRDQPSVGARRRAMGASQNRPPRVLLLATVPPRDDRPDAVALHLTRRTYAEMLRMALAVVSTIPAAQLAVKLHPRAPDDPIARALLSRFPSMESRVISRGPLKRWLAWSDCVLSCISSAGIDATLAGVPVIQLLPAGSGDVLPHEQWGMLGTARTEPELQRLVARALQERVPTSGSVARSVGAGWVERSEPHHNAHNPSRTGPDPNVFRNLDGRCGSRSEASPRDVSRARTPR